MNLNRYQTSSLYNPSSNFPNLRDEMDRLFDAAFPAFSSLQRGFFGDVQGEFPVDLYQDKSAFTVRAELPGFRKEDLNVEVADGILTVTGHQKTEAKANDTTKEVNAQERRVTRSIKLPEDLQLDKIQAAYENGVLTITLPKNEAVKPRQIAVDVK